MKRYSVYHDGVEYENIQGEYFRVEDVAPLLGENQILRESLTKANVIVSRMDELEKLQKELVETKAKLSHYVTMTRGYKRLLLEVLTGAATPNFIKHALQKSMDYFKKNVKPYKRKK